MSSEVVITHIFKLINFILVIIGAWIIFRKYFAQTVSENIRQKELQIINLQEQAALLQRNQHVIDERIAQDKKYAQVLTKKIDYWRNCVENSLRQKAEKESLMKAALQEKQAIQKKHMQQQWFYRQVFPVALQQVQEQLKKQYASQEQQEEFLNSIIKTMKHT